MVLKHDCIRDTMLYLEEHMNRLGCYSSHDIELANYSQDDIDYTVEKLEEAGYLKINSRFMDGSILIQCITYNGHQFLDDIRDNKVWSKTKSILSNFSSTSINMVQNVATQVLSNLISKSI